MKHLSKSPLSKSPTAKKPSFLHSPTNKSFAAGIPESNVIGTRSTSRWGRFVNSSAKGTIFLSFRARLGEVKQQNRAEDFSLNLIYENGKLEDFFPKSFTERKEKS